MSTSTIRIGRRSGKTYGFGYHPCEFHLGKLFELLSKSSNNCLDFDVYFNGNSIVIKIKHTKTDVVIMNYHPSSTPLHVHTISHQNDNTIFVIFDDHILRIRLENSEFVECKTNSFTISSELLQSIIKKSFSTINGGQNLRACFVVDKGYFNQFESYNLLLENVGDRIFDIDNGFSFRLPVNIANIQINGERLEWMIKSKGKRTKFSISLFDGKNDSSNGVPLYLFAQNRYYEDPRTQKIVKSCEGFHISTGHRIDEFERRGCKIIATIDVHLLDKNTGHLIQKLLILNRYSGWDFPDSEAEFESEPEPEPDSDSD
jgi:hypothetical protein